jgi:hypothetical protein
MELVQHRAVDAIAVANFGHRYRAALIATLLADLCQSDLDQVRELSITARCLREYSCKRRGANPKMAV